MMNDLKRILLKLSGEALAGDKDFGFDEATCLKVAKQVREHRLRLSSAAAISGADATAARSLSVRSRIRSVCWVQ